jgi:hypothetical protein
MSLVALGALHRINSDDELAAAIMPQGARIPFRRFDAASAPG